MERAENPISIRVNNIRLQPFNPFPSNLDGVRQTQKKRRLIEGGTIKIDGIILPSKSIEDTSRGATAWCPKGKSLLDMEGIYLYRANRLILSGTWLILLSDLKECNWRA